MYKKATLLSLLSLLSVACLHTPSPSSSVPPLTVQCSLPITVADTPIFGYGDQITLSDIYFRLVKHAPSPFPTLLLLSPSRVDAYGSTIFNSNSGYMEIRIGRDLDTMQRITTLIHEWAHVLSFEAGRGNEDPHGPLWGVCYSIAYLASHRAL